MSMRHPMRAAGGCICVPVPPASIAQRQSASGAIEKSSCKRHVKGGCKNVIRRRQDCLLQGRTCIATLIGAPVDRTGAHLRERASCAPRRRFLDTCSISMRWRLQRLTHTPARSSADMQAAPKSETAAHTGGRSVPHLLQQLQKVYRDVHRHGVHGGVHACVPGTAAPAAIPVRRANRKPLRSQFWTLRPVQLVCSLDHLQQPR